MAEEKTEPTAEATQPEKEWEVTTERFVAFFDIMGFKERVDKFSHEKIMADFHKIKIILNIFQNKMEEMELERVKTTIFSDSIILFTVDNSEESFFSISFCSSTLMNYLLINDIPIKGAISCGKLSVDLDSSIFFGKPIINAFLLLEELNFYGVVIDESVESYIKKKNNNTDFLFRYIYVKYEVPFKFGKAKHYALNWCIDLEEDIRRYKVDKTPTEILDDFSYSMSGKPRIYLDNTMNFFEFCKELDIQKEFNDMKS